MGACENNQMALNRMADKKHNLGPVSDTMVSLDDWVAANQPRLGETRERVLCYAVDAVREHGAVSSRQLREELGLSQQLLNRHLRGLEADGLLRLEKQGPGKPLRIMPTAMGLRVAQRLRPEAAETENASEQLSASSSDPTAPPAGIMEARGLLGAFLSSLMAHLDGQTKDVTPGQLRRALRQALNDFLPIEHDAQPVAPPPQIVYAPPPQQYQPPEPVLPVQGGAHVPPRLSPDEAYEEGRLESTCNSAYRGKPWYDRTKLFSDLWDRQRRGRTGSLSTFFTGFGPRWEHPNWPDFNKARQMADATGAEYGKWLTDQMDRMAKLGQADFMPHLLVGGALYQSPASQQNQAQPLAEDAPYTIDSYDPENQIHLDHARQVINGLVNTAPLIFGEDPDGPVRMVTEAIAHKQLPRKALELVPEIKQKLMARARKGARKEGWWTNFDESAPPVII